MFCPQCGASQSAAPSTAPTDESAPHERPRGFAHRLRACWSALPASFGGGRLYGSDYLAIDYEPRDEERDAHRSRLPLYACGGLTVFALVLAAYVISHRNDEEPAPGVQVVEGAVRGPRDASATPTGEPPALRSAPPAAAYAPPRHGPPAPAGSDSAQQQSLAAQRNLPEQRAPVWKDNANARADVARNLVSARASLDRSSLWPARRAIMNALAEQPGNGDAQRMQAELVSREQERDSQLGYARSCARDGQWACVRQYAGRAAAVDASSREARRLLWRATAAQQAGAAGRFDAGRAGRSYRQASDGRSRQWSLWEHH